LKFKGIGEYLEYLVARIDTPLLDDLDIILFHELISDTPQLAQFVSCTPKSETYNEAHVLFTDQCIFVALSQGNDGGVHLAIQCNYGCSHRDQLSTLVKVCRSSSPQAFFPAVEELYIADRDLGPLYWEDSFTESDQ
jgi:hypothetical protein